MAGFSGFRFSGSDCHKAFQGLRGSRFRLEVFGFGISVLTAFSVFRF